MRRTCGISMLRLCSGEFCQRRSTSSKVLEFQAQSNAKAGHLSHEVGGTFDARLARAGFGGRYAMRRTCGISMLRLCSGEFCQRRSTSSKVLDPALRRYWALILTSP
jgi:hypothetical protein